MKRPLWRQYLTIIDRHLGLTTVMGFLLVLGVLVTLFSFIELLGQINDIGKGDYQVGDAFLFVALTIPRRAVDLMPVSMLLGSIVSLTPGTVSIEIDMDAKRLFVHALDVADREQLIATIKSRYEAPLKEIFAC